MTADRQHFEEVVRDHGPRVLAYLVRRSIDPADAADVYQEVLVVTWKRLDRAPADHDAAAAWMFGAARRCLANHRRGHARRMAATQHLYDQLLTTSPHPDAAQELVQAALADLAEAERELLTLVYWDGLTTDQAASVLKIKPASARKRLERARAKLRHQMDRLTREDVLHVDGRSKLDRLTVRGVER